MDKKKADKIVDRIYAVVLFLPILPVAIAVVIDHPNAFDVFCFMLFWSIFVHPFILWWIDGKTEILESAEDYYRVEGKREELNKCGLRNLLYKWFVKEEKDPKDPVKS